MLLLHLSLFIRTLTPYHSAPSHGQASRLPGLRGSGGGGRSGTRGVEGGGEPWVRKEEREKNGEEKKRKNKEKRKGKKRKGKGKINKRGIFWIDYIVS